MADSSDSFDLSDCEIEVQINEIETEDDSEIENNNCSDQEPGIEDDYDDWHYADGSTLYTFQNNHDNSGFVMDNPLVNEDSTPLDFYKLFVTEDIINDMVKFTNLYVEQKKVTAVAKKEKLPQFSFLAQWNDTTPEEMWMFFSVILWMGLDRKPQIRDYWLSSILYTNRNVIELSGISRSRFQSLLSFFHFSDNKENNDDRMYKLNNLIHLLRNNFQKYVIPGKCVCIDEIMVPFRGKIFFRQYIKGKRHKYGLKLYKLCLDKGYTYNFNVYTGKNASERGSVVIDLVSSLMEPLMYQGRIVHVDNFFTSVSLAQHLLQRETYLIGMLRANRKHNPKEVINQKLKKGEMTMLEKHGVIVGKWKDKQDVLFLTTESKPDFSTVISRRKEVKTKPTTILKYNKAKSFVDVSDQMTAYSTTLRRSIKWYHKLALELLTNTAIVNAYLYYKHVTANNITITKFREQIVCDILKNANPNAKFDETGSVGNENHKLVKKSKRNRCIKCYEKIIRDTNSRDTAMKSAKKVDTMCEACGKSFYVPCFFQKHKCTI